MRISEIITDKYKLRILPTVYYDLLADVQELEEEQEQTTKNDLGVDAISRIETIDYLCKHCPDDGECFKDCDEIKHLRNLPSVTPQEPFINKPCVSSGVCEHDKQKVLEKIRAEIQELPIQFTCAREMQKWSLEIIDKYKSEIEPQESEDKE